MPADLAKSPLGGQTAPVENYCFILMTSDIKWALHVSNVSNSIILPLSG